MKAILLLFLAAVNSCSPTSSRDLQNDDISIPRPKLISLYNGTCNVSSEIIIHDTSNYLNAFEASLNSFKNTCSVYGRNQKTESQIYFSTNINNIKEDYSGYLNKPESYIIFIKKNTITITSKNKSGMLCGLSTLEYMVEFYKGSLPMGSIIDYPDILNRVLHLSLWPCSLNEFQEVIRFARLNHFNKLVLINQQGVKLDYVGENALKNAWSKTDFIQEVQFIRENGLELIPELKLLSHQKKFLGNSHPDLLYNKATYNPNNKNVYKYVFKAIDELLTITRANRFHIGHDEVVGWNERHYQKKIILKDEQQLPPELFLKDIKILHDYLSKKGIETWMWGDMLIDPEMFTEMNKAGGINGYNEYASIKDSIPRDIVICDWHYRGDQFFFPSSKLFLELGHKVYGATWKNEETTKNFARYIYSLKDAEGMIATTWYGIENKKEEIIKIIEFSGENFWNVN